jgi:hypothetical protein
MRATVRDPQASVADVSRDERPDRRCVRKFWLKGSDKLVATVEFQHPVSERDARHIPSSSLTVFERLPAQTVVECVVDPKAEEVLLVGEDVERGITGE